jgi:type IV secretion system protein VirB11
MTHPVFAIRRRAVRVFTLDEYVDSGVMTFRQCKNLRAAIHDRQNVLVLSGTGSGKTTLGNAVLHEITAMEPDARLIIIEDTAELNATAENKVNYQTSPACSMTDLLQSPRRQPRSHKQEGRE